LLREAYPRPPRRCSALIKATFQAGNYFAILGWLQWVLRNRDCPYMFAEKIDHALQLGHAAYRVLDRHTIVPVGSEAELKTTQQAFADLAATEFHGARAHL
jgi:hypothetical protein